MAVVCQRLPGADRFWNPTVCSIFGFRSDIDEGTAERAKMRIEIDRLKKLADM